MQLNAKTTALVLIDLQKGVLCMPVLPPPASTVYARSKELASRLRAAGGPIVWVRVSFASNFADAPRARVDQPRDMGPLHACWAALPLASVWSPRRGVPGSTATNSSFARISALI